MRWRPVDAAGVDKQLLMAINACRQEYGIPPQKMHRTQEIAGRHIPMQRCALPGSNKDEATLRRTRVSFDRLP